MTDCQVCQLRRRSSPAPGLCIVCFRRLDFEKLPPKQQRERFLALVHARYVDAEIEDLPGSLASQLVESSDTESIYLWGRSSFGISEILTCNRSRRSMDPWGLLMHTALVTGMRRAELLNATWRDVRFDGQTIEVCPKEKTAETWEFRAHAVDNESGKLLYSSDLGHERP